MMLSAASGGHAVEIGRRRAMQEDAGQRRAVSAAFSTGRSSGAKAPYFVGSRQLEGTAEPCGAQC